MLQQQYHVQCFNGIDPIPPLSENPRHDYLATAAIVRDIVATSRTLCVMTLLADDSVYINFETTQELVQMLHIEFNNYVDDSDDE